jgi:hypothetical protein
MTLVTADRRFPKHANPAVPSLIGPGSGYVGRRRIPEPDWLTGLATAVMEDAWQRAGAVGIAGTSRP